ncbi:MAG: VanZ family protein [Prosthecobacter sp.]
MHLHTRRIMAWGACLLGIVLLIMPLPQPGNLGWTPMLRDWSHAGVFALMAWMVMRFQMMRPHPLRWTAFQTVGLMLLMAAGTELIQTLTGRSMDVADFLQDVTGVVVGMAAALTAHARSLPAKAGLGVLAACMLVFSTRDLIQRGNVVWQKAAMFPLLEDFESDEALQLWHLERQGHPVDLQLLTNVQTKGRRLHVAIHASGLTSLHGDALSQDWSGWSHFVFDCELSAPADLLLGVRIDNALEPKKRLNLEVTLKPGSSLAVVPLPSSPEAQKVLQKTGQIVLHALDPGVDAVLRLDHLRLERR